MSDDAVFVGSDSDHSPKPEPKNDFDALSTSDKLEQLNLLVQKSQVYTQIILDNMMEKSLQKKAQLKRQEEERKAKEAKSLEEAKSGKKAEKAAEPDSDSDVEIVQVRRSSRRTADEAEPKSRKRKKSKKKSSKKREKTPEVVVVSEKTKDTKRAIEMAQTAHNQVQPSRVTGCTMKDYQLDGLEWLATLYENGLNGILADEMGLGKTLQCISLFCHLIENGIKGPFLVVVPLSTADNWMSEFKRFAPSVKVMAYIGQKDERAAIKLKKNAKQVVLTTYETVIKDFTRLKRISWEYLIVDEGHRLKNADSVLFQKLKRLSADNRLLLTGTPLQNNLRELWSLLNFILPFIFQDAELFDKWLNFDDLKASAGDFEKEEQEIYKAAVESKLIENLHTTLKPFILRRLKKDVIKDLPPKKEYIVYSSLSPLQNKLYVGSMKGQLPQTLIELYTKEHLLQDHKRLFSTEEDLKVVDSLLEESKATAVVGKRARTSRYSSSVLSAFLENADEPASKRTRNQKSSSRSTATPKDSDDYKPPQEKLADHYQKLETEKVNQPAVLERNPVLDFTLSIIPNLSKIGGSATHLLLGARYFQKGLYGYYSLKKRLAGQPLTPENSQTWRDVIEKTFAFRHSLAAVMDTSVLERAYENEMKQFFNGRIDPIEHFTPAKVDENGLSRATEATKEENSQAENENEESESETESIDDIDSIENLASEDELEILEAPEIVEVTDGELTREEEQVAVAQSILQDARQHVRSLKLQNSLMQRRNICASHYTYYQPFAEETEKTELALGELIFKHSGKMQLLEKILQNLVKEGHKVLIFSQFTRALDLIEYRMSACNITFSRLDGRMNREDRAVEIGDFSTYSEDGTQVFLLSTRAGGLGLNLIHADTVILFDNDWNPQMDVQAIDRVHRIGQTKPVKIIRFVVKNTVEELLIMRSFGKRALEKMVIQSGKFGLSRVAEKLAAEEIDMSAMDSIRSLNELEKRLQRHESEKVEDVKNLNQILLDENVPKLDNLTDEEMQELMDRSPSCYTQGHKEYTNMASFETLGQEEE